MFVYSDYCAPLCGERKRACKDKDTSLYSESVMFELYEMTFFSNYLATNSTSAPVPKWKLLTQNGDTFFFSFNISGSAQSWHRGGFECQYAIVVRSKTDSPGLEPHSATARGEGGGHGQMVSLHCASVPLSTKWEWHPSASHHLCFCLHHGKLIGWLNKWAGLVEVYCGLS